MRHTNFIAKDTSFKIISTADTDVSVWKFTLDDGLVSQDSVTPEAIGDYYKATISVPDEDCFILVVQDEIAGITRVGDPEVLVIIYTGETGDTLNYKQYDMDGSELDSGTATEIDEGFYYIEPESLDLSYFDIEGVLKTLNVPYKVVNCTEGGDGVSATKNFVNVGFNTIGFLGNRHSYFDLDQGKWINDDDVEAKASDLAKAVCHKYDLVWDDKDDEKWIGNYVKYLRSYTENDGKVRYYKVAVTPETNDANFDLMQTDEGGNLVVKGVSLLILQSLESINDTDGVIIPFAEAD